MTTLYDFKIKDIMGNEWDLDELRGKVNKKESISIYSPTEKVVMIVNVASKCSYVKQYSSLEEIYLRYKSQDFVIIGCPCNQFAGQEPAPETEIYNYCTIHWSVTFPLTSKL
jgi:glutathione peroxidase